MGKPNQTLLVLKMEKRGGRAAECGQPLCARKARKLPPPQPVERIQLSPHSDFSPVRPVPVRSVTYKAMRR